MSDVESEDEDENGNRGPRMTHRRPAWRADWVNDLVDQLNEALTTRKTGVEYGEPSEREGPAIVPDQGPKVDSNVNDEDDQDLEDLDQDLEDDGNVDERQQNVD